VNDQICYTPIRFRGISFPLLKTEKFQDFNPRAGAATSEDDDDFQFDPRAVSQNGGSPTNNFSPPAANVQQPPFVMSPPPALPPRDNQVSVLKKLNFFVSDEEAAKIS
jgi:hypothetical protein